MELKRLAYAMLAAGMLLPMVSSCKSDPNPFDMTFTSESNKAKISLQFEVAATRAEGDASAMETKISQVNVYVFDSSNEIEALETNHDITSGSPVVLEVSPGQKIIYAVSAKTIIPTATVGTTMAAFEEALFSSKVEDLQVTVKSGDPKEFVMVGKSESQYVLKSVSESTIPESNIFKIELKRLLAKAQVKMNKDMDLSDLGFTIDGNPQFGESQTANNMRLKPNGIDACDFSQYKFDSSNGYKDVITTGDFNNGTKCVYIPENIVNNPVAGNTTFVFLAVPMKPTHVYSYTGSLSRTTNTATSLAGFYAVGIVDAENGFQDYAIDAANNGQIITFINKSDADAYVAALNGGEASAMTISESESSLLAPAAGTRAESSRKFQSLLFSGGTVYYRINIKDADGKCKVERNKFYKITVNSINSLGSHSKDMLRPANNNAPLDITSSVWVKAEFTVADWDPVEQNVDL